MMWDTADGDEVTTADGGLPNDATTHGLAADDLDQRLAGALERMGHVARTMLSRQAYLEGVSPLQFQLLLKLESTAGPRVSDLAIELDVSQATVSDALGTMRRKELVSKQQDPADRRNSVFSLTQQGESLRRRLARWDQPIADRLAPLEVGEKGTALRVVLEVVSGLQDEGVINVARTCLTCRFFDDTTHPETATPYHCLLLDVPFADPQLRVDCAEHEPRTVGAAT